MSATSQEDLFEDLSLEVDKLKQAEAELPQELPPSRPNTPRAMPTKAMAEPSHKIPHSRQNTPEAEPSHHRRSSLSSESTEEWYPCAPGTNIPFFMLHPLGDGIWQMGTDNGDAKEYIRVDSSMPGELMRARDIMRIYSQDVPVHETSPSDIAKQKGKGESGKAEDTDNYRGGKAKDTDNYRGGKAKDRDTDRSGKAEDTDNYRGGRAKDTDTDRCGKAKDTDNDRSGNAKDTDNDRSGNAKDTDARVYVKRTAEDEARRLEDREILRRQGRRADAIPSIHDGLQQDFRYADPSTYQRQLPRSHKHRPSYTNIAQRYQPSSSRYRAPTGSRHVPQRSGQWPHQTDTSVTLSPAQADQYVTTDESWVTARHNGTGRAFAQHGHSRTPRRKDFCGVTFRVR